MQICKRHRDQNVHATRNCALQRRWGFPLFIWYKFAIASLVQRIRQSTSIIAYSEVGVHLLTPSK